MRFDPENPIVKLCVRGIGMEGEAQAGRLYQQAWNEATTDIEKFMAAHYLARCQKSVSDKLVWDKLALNHALNANVEGIESVLPSLYLNIAKGYEDLGELEKARDTYHRALSFASHLADDGYGLLIGSGITNGLARIQAANTG